MRDQVAPNLCPCKGGPKVAHFNAYLARTCDLQTLTGSGALKIMRISMTRDTHNHLQNGTVRNGDSRNFAKDMRALHDIVHRTVRTMGHLPTKLTKDVIFHCIL